jgi:hypothetical protein
VVKPLSGYQSLNTMTENLIKLPPELEAHLKAEKKLLANYAKLKNKLNNSDCVTLVRYTIKAHIATTFKTHFDEINKCINDNADVDSDGSGTYDSQPANKLLDKLHWQPWCNDCFGCFTENPDFDVQSDRGYIAFNGDVSRLIDLVMNDFDYEWNEEDDLGFFGGIKITELKA